MHDSCITSPAGRRNPRREGPEARRGFVWRAPLRGNPCWSRAPHPISCGAARNGGRRMDRGPAPVPAPPGEQDERRRIPRTDAVLADPRLAEAAARLGRGVVKAAVVAAQRR
ncbi:hypothetical protein, partial [Actinomadura sp. RB99]|uniref:hypothetical protein n=1 Tax=Actinomadura sp. RB99 TaxID=2691577 RepID=UPI00321FA3B5